MKTDAAQPASYALTAAELALGLADLEYTYRSVWRTCFNAERNRKTSAATVAKHRAHLAALSTRMHSMRDCALTVTAGVGYARVEASEDGKRVSVTLTGAGCEIRARALTAEVRDVWPTDGFGAVEHVLSQAADRAAA